MSPCESTSSVEPAFAQRFDIFLQGSEETKIFCAVCQDSTLIKYNGKSIISECGHYVACNECRTRIIRQILRCPTCCRGMASEFPVCGQECEEVSQLLSSGLSTSQCPRCCQKLTKSTCGKTCNRTETKEYKRAYKKLLTCVGTMVLKPELCEKPEYPGERPCSHFSKCREHGTITRGRAHQPRCPQCKSQRKKERRFSSVSNQYVPGMFEVKWG